MTGGGKIVPAAEPEKSSTVTFRMHGAHEAVGAMQRKLAAIKHQHAQRRKPLAVEASHESAHVHATHGAESWRGRLIHHLHSRPIQLLLTALLVADIVVVMVELFIEAEFPRCAYVVRDAVSCCATGSSTHAATHAARLLASSDAHDETHHHSLCLADLSEAPDHAAGCDEHKHSGVHTAHEALFGTSVAILAIFLVELLLLLLALGTKFLSNFLYVLDFVVVAGSLSLELALKSNASLAALAEVIILARLWRLIRIGHGLYTTGFDANERHVHELEAQLETIKEVLAQTQQGAQIQTQAWAPAASEL